MLTTVGAADGSGGEVIDLAQVAAVCAAVVGCYDRVLDGDRTVALDLDDALTRARALGGVSGRLGWALGLVGRGAAGATTRDLAVAIATLRRTASEHAERSSSERSVSRPDRV
jgi:hypothetical protein